MTFHMVTFDPRGILTLPNSINMTVVGIGSDIKAICCYFSIILIKVFKSCVSYFVPCDAIVSVVSSPSLVPQTNELLLSRNFSRNGFAWGGNELPLHGSELQLWGNE